MNKYRWSLTPKTNQLLIELEAQKLLLEISPLKPNLELNLRRRFSVVNEKTLHYDLAKLKERGFINKLGETRGVVYSAK